MMVEDCGSIGAWLMSWVQMAPGREIRRDGGNLIQVRGPDLGNVKLKCQDGDDCRDSNDKNQQYLSLRICHTVSKLPSGLRISG